MATMQDNVLMQKWAGTATLQQQWGDTLTTRGKWWQHQGCFSVCYLCQCHVLYSSNNYNAYVNDKTVLPLSTREYCWKLIFTYKSCGLGQAKHEPSCEWWLWPGLGFEEAKATAPKPSQARTALFGNLKMRNFDMYSTFAKQARVMWQHDRW